MSHTPRAIASQIATTIDASEKQTAAAISLLDEGATVPFIARYRKEITGGLSDAQLRNLEERLNYLRELEARREAIVQAIKDQGKLDDALHQKLQLADTKAQLEDLYLPFKKKRRTKGEIAKEHGLEPLAEVLWNQPDQQPSAVVASYLEQTQQDSDNPFKEEKAVLDGAKHLLMERFAEDASLIAKLRELLEEKAYLCSTVNKGKQQEGVKFSDYFEHYELYKKVPGHRALAMFRGRSEGFLSLHLLLKSGDEYNDDECIALIARHVGFQDQQKPGDAWRGQVVAWTWKIKLSMHLENELMANLRTAADATAIEVFVSNLKDLLLAAPAGSRPTIGLDPGYRSGVKVAVVDASGKLLDHTTIYPHKPQGQWTQAVHTLAGLCKQHRIELVAVGNGTASRETEKLADEVIVTLRQAGSNVASPMSKVMVSEAGASVYSASKLADAEFPDIDVTIRGAVSIARRLQDPLAELVKIDPKAIGVGQYQHDVSQTALAKSLEATVEDCVNGVGVNLETASSALLTYVAGLNKTLAENIVQYREQNGTFDTRKELLKVPRLGPKAFEQAAGFLRIPNGSNALDASAVHPESYPVVKNILAQLGMPLPELIGNQTMLRGLQAEQFVSDQVGVPTVKDIISELEKPGRDPRPAFQAVQFADGVEKISDLSPNQVLEGKVTNVTAFGAFVDVGVHQDGLVHISALSDTFVKDPREVVKTGDIVKVKVMSVDTERKRIALSMRLGDDANEHADSRNTRASTPSKSRSAAKPKQAVKSKGSQPAKVSQTDAPSALALSLQAALQNKK